MVLVSCGINHKTAPLSLREKVAINDTQALSFLQNITEIPAVNEAAFLSTCNRTEIYCDSGNPEEIMHWFSAQHDIEPEIINPHFYVHQGYQSVKHAIRVATGLDSMMMGEPQILGQMKKAYNNACMAGTLNHKLRPVFDYILQASKRVAPPAVSLILIKLYFSDLRVVI